MSAIRGKTGSGRDAVEVTRLTRCGHLNEAPAGPRWSSVEIDQPVTDAIGLVEPDAILVVHADVPEGVHRPAGIVWHRQTDPLFVARLRHLALEIEPSSRR
jgi:hypothetical protein